MRGRLYAPSTESEVDAAETGGRLTGPRRAMESSVQAAASSREIITRRVVSCRLLVVCLFRWTAAQSAATTPYAYLGSAYRGRIQLSLGDPIVRRVADTSVSLASIQFSISR